MKQFSTNNNFEQIASSLFEGVIISDRNGFISFFNKVVLDYFPKLSKSDLIGKHLSFVIHSKDLEMFLLNKSEMRNITIFIGLNQLLANFRYMDNDNILIVFKNITNLQNTLNELKEANNQIRLFHTILEKVDEGVCFIDNNQKVVFYNSKMGELDSKEPSGVRDESYGYVFQKASYKIDPLLNALVNERKITQNESFFSNSGKKYTVHKMSEPLFLGNKKIGALSIVRDFSKTEALVSNMILNKYDKLDNPVQVEEPKNVPTTSFISTSKSMQKVVHNVAIASKTNSNVLIYGESGSGKSIIANYISEKDKVGSKSFFCLDCGALPENLLDDILFGNSEKAGLLELANGGTILLDEVNKMGIALQEKLLKILKNKKLLGRAAIEIPINIRVLSLMNEKPETALKNRQLLEEIFYILASITINIPPLRERKEDIQYLVENFIESLKQSNNHTQLEVSDYALEILCKYDYPGNVRQLGYILECSEALLLGGSVILPEHLPEYVFEKSETFDTLGPVESRSHRSTSPHTLTEQVEAFEKEIIVSTLTKTNFHITNAADKLGITRQSLNYKIKKYEITIARGEN